MIRANQLRRIGASAMLLGGEVPVQRKRLEHLERVERAHAAYLGATSTMRTHAERLHQQRGGITERDQGYLDCLRDFSLAVLDADRQREAA